MLQCPRGYWPVLLGTEWLLIFWLTQEVALAHPIILMTGSLLTLLPVALISRYRQQHRPVAARALQHQPQTQAEGEQQHRQIGALHQMQADAPQTKPGGGEDKGAADHRQQAREYGLHCQLSNIRRASSTSLLTPSFSSRLAR